MPLAVSNSFYYENLDTFVSTILDKHYNKIWCMSLTPGYSSRQNPHRSKLANIVILLIVLLALCKYFKIAHGSIKVSLNIKYQLANNNIII